MECPHCHRETSFGSKTCRHCGRGIPPAQHLLEESGIVEPAVYEPVDESPPVQSDDENDCPYRLASLGDRFVAFAFDLVFLFGVFATVDAWAFMRWGAVEGTALRLSLAVLLITEFLNAAILFLYLWISEAAFGATVGKALVGIRVVRTTQRNRFSAFAIRNLLRFVDGIGFYLLGMVVAGCSRARRRIGDVCAGTAVIEDDFGYPSKIVAVALWIGIIAGAIWSVPRICQSNPAIRSRYLNQVVIEVRRTNNVASLTIAGVHIQVEIPPATAQQP
jgi:uncharacterized RDD family membrane protein YckC